MVTKEHWTETPTDFERAWNRARQAGMCAGLSDGDPFYASIWYHKGAADIAKQFAAAPHAPESSEVRQPTDIGLDEDVFKLPDTQDRRDLEWCTVLAALAYRENTFTGRAACRAINLAVNIAVRLLAAKAAQ